MLLWNIIRDWFVNYVFGGLDSIGSSEHSNAILGMGILEDKSDYALLNTNNFCIPINNWFDWDSEQVISYISLGDWLSTTATLIVMISICVGLWFLVRYFFRMFAGLISGR